MRFRISLAFLASIILIGVASWHRLSPSASPQPALVASERSAGEDNDLLKYFNESEEDTPTTGADTIAKETPTKTDLLSIDLFTDYISMANAGEPSPAGIQKLADHYVDVVGTLPSVEKLDYSSIKTVADNKNSREKYSSDLTSIYLDFRKKIEAINAGLSLSDSDSYVEFSGKASGVYLETALRLENTPVPTSLSFDHLRLINLHLSNAAAMSSVHELEEDPLTAIASLVAIKQNATEEATILNKFGQALQTNAI